MRAADGRWYRKRGKFGFKRLAVAIEVSTLL
jgi:hypothetical protein